MTALLVATVLAHISNRNPHSNGWWVSGITKPNLMVSDEYVGLFKIMAMYNIYGFYF
jgi:hypothetical protein